MNQNTRATLEQSAPSQAISAPQNREPVKPQVFYGMSFEDLHDDLILSVDENGAPLSRFKDLTWEMTQLKLVITDKTTYSFEPLKCDTPANQENIKLVQVLFLMRMFSKKGTTKELRASSHFGSMYSLFFLCKYADDNNTSIKNLLHTPALYKPMLEKIAPAPASVLWQIFRIFNITKCPKHWFSIASPFMKSLKKVYKGRSHRTSRQHPVIPPRILNLRWGHYHEVLNDFQQHRAQLTEIIRAATINRLYARGPHSQLMIKQRQEVNANAPQAPFFKEAIASHGLTWLCKKYAIDEISKLPSYLGLVQYCAKALIHILTFMRSGEALLLEQECLTSAVGWCEEGVYVMGVSTKATGKPVDTKWITIEDIQIPLKNLMDLYDIISPYLPSEHNGIKNLFISPANIPIAKNNRPGLLSICTSSQYEKRLPDIIIEEGDLCNLELIDPLREWRSEEKFKLGEPWRFTSHQYRRTMTVYCAEDQLMEIGALKRVLGHLSKKTSEHYQRGCSAGVLRMSECSPEIMAEFKEAALIASNAIYIRDILYSEEKLHGVEGRKIQKRKEANNFVLEEKLDELISRRNKGLIACTTTPIGLCLSLAPCEKRAHADFTTCDGCSDSVIKLSKLNYVIEVLSFDIKDMDPNSFEYKMDKQNLEDLERMRDRLVAKANR